MQGGLEDTILEVGEGKEGSEGPGPGYLAEIIQV